MSSQYPGTLAPIAQAEGIRATHVPGTYVLGVEWLRLVACVAVVAFHAQVPGYLYALGGLHVFAVFLAVFAIRSARLQGWASFARKRSRTLAVPWAFWTLFYAVFVALDHYRHGKEPFAWVHDGRWLEGPSIHLWFLPWALVTSWVLYPLARSTRMVGWRPWLFITLVAIALVAWTADLPMPEPWAQWLSVLPGATLGIVLADDASRPFRVFISVGLAAMLLGLSLIGYEQTGIPLLVGLPAAVLAFETRLATNARLLVWSHLALGVYLVHPLTMRLLHKPFGDSPWLLFLLSSIAAFALVLALKRTPLKAVV